MIVTPPTEQELEMTKAPLSHLSRERVAANGPMAL
jgi:hypothetical protein